MTQVNDLEFVTTGENDWQVATVAEASLGRQGHPVDAMGQRTGAVGLDGDALTGHFFEASDEILIDPQRRLATREHDERSGGVAHHLLDNLGQRHQRALFVPRVTERAMQVATAQPDEHAGSACVIALTLQGVEDLVNFVHFRLQVLGLRWIYP